MRRAGARVRGAQRAHPRQPDGRPLVVEMDGRVEILNPAGHRLLDVAPGALGRDYRELLAGARRCVT